MQVIAIGILAALGIWFVVWYFKQAFPTAKDFEREAKDGLALLVFAVIGLAIVGGFRFLVVSALGGFK